ncbi:MAG: alkaline phosphatase family protein [Actinobacteria bacterium]|nr:alkaline phosphatase family protein [Actinomycetota bacterium]
MDHEREGYWKDRCVAQTLAELSQSIFATLGLDGATNSLALSEQVGRRECLLLVDGLGKNAIDEFGSKIKRLSELSYERTLTATFPSTTATSLTSLGTGLAPGEHGMVGYTMRVPNSGTPERVLNALKWDERVDPYIFQPNETLFERANQAGIRTSHIAAKRYAETGFTRAALRGGIYFGANSIDELAEGASTALKNPNSFAYLYMNDVDEASHGAGFGSEKFLLALDKFDRLLEQLLRNLPKGTRLWVTSDHGMINRGEYLVVGKDNDLLKDVRLMAGEPRVRYLYVDEDKRDEVKSRWQEQLGEKATLLTRDEAIAEGIFGPTKDSVLERIGDLIVIAEGNFILVEMERESQQCAMVGHHGGTTKAECEIPLLTRSI